MFNKLKRFGLLLVLILLFMGCITSAKTSSYQVNISPISFGLLQARNGEERYDILLKTHRTAIEKGVGVDYSGISTIDITIPKNAQSIPLGSINDFNNVVFNVENKNQDGFLFKLINDAHYIDISGSLIDKGVFSSIPQLKFGTKLLIIEDKKPWVERRRGYAYGHTRRDILLLKGGKALNSVIMPYDNRNSVPTCKFYSPKYKSVLFQNITLNRKQSSTAKTYLCDITGFNNVQLNNVTINTPLSDMVEDMAIHISECTNVDFNGVVINGTYSKLNHSGYGISMNNIWNYTATNINGIGNWGIFGCNNINKAYIENSIINRFDIHCYGRDVKYKNVIFNKLSNQYSSVFGTIIYEQCTFNDFIPVLYESSYNAYSNHSVIISNCTINLTKDHNYIIRAGLLSNQRNQRHELSVKYWPHLKINNLTVNVPSGVSEMFVYYVVQDVSDSNNLIDAINSIEIKGLDCKYKSNYQVPINLKISNISVNSPNDVRVVMERVNLLSPELDKNTAQDVLEWFGGKVNVNINENTKRKTVILNKSKINN